MMKFLKWAICFALKQLTEGLVLVYQFKPDNEFKELTIDFMCLKDEIIKKLKAKK